MVRLLDHLRKGAANNEEEIDRVAGKTYRQEPLKKRKPFRRTSVSSVTFSVTRIIVTLVLSVVAIGVIGYIGWQMFDLFMNW